MSGSASEVLRAPVTFVTGKGGVGKTTVAAGLALGFARAGARVALVELDDDEAGKRALAGSGARSGVTHLVAAYHPSLEEAIGGIVGGALVARTVLRHSAVKRLVEAVPALREFVSLEKVRSLLASRSYDRVVVDLPASGHAIDWLRVPAAFERFLKGGPLGNLARRVREEVITAGRSDVVLVTLAEPLVIRETAELAGKLADEIGRGPALVVVNRVSAPDAAGAIAAAERLATSASDEPLARRFVTLLEGRARVAEESLEALRLARGIGSTRIFSLPDAPTDPSGAQVAEWLAAETADAGDAGGPSP
jgi:anion-transporting  ArsA/GET3 family ATPase